MCVVLHGSQIFCATMMITQITDNKWVIIGRGPVEDQDCFRNCFNILKICQLHWCRAVDDPREHWRHSLYRHIPFTDPADIVSVATLVWQTKSSE